MAEAAPGAGSPRRVLVVEDSEPDFALIAHQLRRAGLNVEAHRVETPEELRAALGAGPWDAILSDHQLPRFSSVGALEMVRGAGGDWPFIIVSGEIGEEQAVDAMKAGAQDYVSKRNLGRLIPVLEREWRDAHQRRQRRRAETELEAMNREHQRRLTQRSALLDITSAIVEKLDRAGLFRAIFEALRRITPCDVMAVALRSRAGAGYDVCTLRAEPGEAGPRISNRDAVHLDLAGEGASAFPLGRFLEAATAAIGGPIAGKAGVIGWLAVASRLPNAYSAADREFVAEVCGQVSLAATNVLAYEEIEELKSRLESEKAYLLDEIKTEHNFDEMVGASPAFRNLSARIRRVAPTSASVLILGETGTGKELIARALHNLSPRRVRPLVKVNCAAISAGLVESELFGHEKGAFTGAIEKRIGRFEFANGGTVFLDEVGELPPETQAKILRVLQEQEFEPVGSNRTVRVDTRVIAATNRQLEEAVREGKFRADLYYRLNVVPIEVPPLRERKEDIPLLVTTFLGAFSRKFGRPVEGVTRAAMDRMLEYPWPGNIRELENLLARAVVLAQSPLIDVEVLALPGTLAAAAADSPAGMNLEETSRRHILDVLGRTRWVIEGPAGAARLLGLHPNTLRSRMKKLGIRRLTP
jgi:transcriptional regulator with GAF, ATPase, and Fis domain/CheY-like chemotaxis protein